MSGIWALGWFLLWAGEGFLLTVALAALASERSRVVENVKYRNVSCSNGGVTMKRILALLLIAGSLHGENRFWKWTAAAMVAGSAADAMSSYGQLEANPALRGADGRFGAKAIGLKLGVAGGTLLVERIILRKDPRAGVAIGVANLASAGTFGALAARNWRMPK
jgi:hypothetical protein